MEGLRLFGAFRGQQRRSTSTAERLRRENYHGHGAIWGTGYIGVRCTQEVGSSSTEPSNRGRDSNTSRRFPWRHRVAARGAAQVAAATSSRRREYVQSDRVRSHRPLLAMSGMPGCVEATDLHEPSPSYPSLPSLRAMEDKTMID